jgi:hypothetical protein
LDILGGTERQVQFVRMNLRIARSRQKGYANHGQRDLSFDVGDFVYINVSHMRGLRHLKVKKACTKIHWSIQDVGKKR